MTRSERVLKFFMMAGGVVMLFATVAVFMPYSWMNSIHGWLGMGRLPDGPITGYLARSTSALYAMLGGLFCLVSRDVRRYRTVIAYFGTVMACFGLVLLGVDIREGMPLFWILLEGPTIIVLTSTKLILLRGVGSDRGRSTPVAA